MNRVFAGSPAGPVRRPPPGPHGVRDAPEARSSDAPVSVPPWFKRTVESARPEREHKYRPHVGTLLGWTGGLGVPLHTETVLSGGDRQERREGGNDVPNSLVDALFHRAAGIATGTRRSALAVIHHGNRVRS